ncbi:MAG TPA: acyl-CoA reductase [Bacteroidales bacterium]|nr:acyl-CoA reductase [Bacteroidales bacterium]
MLKNFKEIKTIYPQEPDLDLMIKTNPGVPFDEQCVDFLNELSVQLYKDPRTKAYPDVATFAFFCRKANILQLKSNYSHGGQRIGRGLIFHVAPSNVPLNFAYSLLCGLLSGNSNIVRVPSKEFVQVGIICEALHKIREKEESRGFSSRILLVRYDHQTNATDYFSSLCDVRIIWGGDNTIETIRKSKIPPRSFDVTFADRYSFCIINADEYIKEPTPDKIAQSFYNDTYLFDQNACTAPHLVIWLGSSSDVEKAKNIFWHELHKIVKEKYHVQPVIAVDKLSSFYGQSLRSPGIKKIPSQDNLLWRVELKKLPDNIDEFRCSSGYFSEYHACSLSEIAPIINRKFQTITYWGLNKKELSEFMEKSKPFGIDRIVPIGRSMEFSLVWDGFDLIRVLSRAYEIR